MEMKNAQQGCLQSLIFTIQDQIPSHVDTPLQHHDRVAVPAHLREQIWYEYISISMVGHFSGPKTYDASHTGCGGMKYTLMHFAIPETVSQAPFFQGMEVNVSSVAFYFVTAFLPKSWCACDGVAHEP